MSKTADESSSAGARSNPNRNVRVGYMHSDVVQSLYVELADESLDNAVDNLWTHILRRYFEQDDGFGIALQPRSWPGVSKTKADIAIRYISNRPPRQVCLIEAERVRYESSTSVWKDALRRLTNYMTAARVGSPSPEEAIYGIVTVGHYSRFYELKDNDTTLHDLSGYGGEPLHFKNDELEIDTILCRLVQLTKSERITEQILAFGISSA